VDVTTNPYETYERLVEEEDRRVRQLETCELAQTAILDLYYNSKEPLDRETVQEILKAVHAIDLRLQSELLDLRLEKMAFACQLKKYT
jgi:hypothetical protein